MSQPRDLARLITTYQWLAGERDALEGSRRHAARRAIDQAIDETFLKILRFPADDPRIVCYQIDFLVSALADGDANASVGPELRDVVLSHVKRLAERVPTSASVVAMPHRSRQN